MLLADKGKSSRFSFQSPGNAKPEIEAFQFKVILLQNASTCFVGLTFSKILIKLYLITKLVELF